MCAGSSCALLKRFSTDLQFIAETQLKVQHCLHVLGDFLFIAQDEDICSGDLDFFLTFCKSVDVPVAEDKTQVLEFVGITLRIPLRCSILPNDKGSISLELLKAVSQKEKVTLQQLQKLAGHLAFACRVVITSTGATPAKNMANAAGALRNALTACNTLEGTERFSGAVWISARNGQRTS